MALAKQTYNVTWGKVKHHHGPFQQDGLCRQANKLAKKGRAWAGFTLLTSFEAEANLISYLGLVDYFMLLMSSSQLE